MCKTIVISTTEEANAMLAILEAEHKHAQANDYAAEKAKRVRRMTCTCCGQSYRGRQWWNQDCGYGLGDCCVRFCGVDPDGGESQTYGVPGIHFLIGKEGGCRMNTVTLLDWCDSCERTVQDWRERRKRRAYEITEEAYWWGLECVPPAMMKSTAYLCGEAYTDNEAGEPLYSAAVQTEGRYYALGLMTKRELREFTAFDMDSAIAEGNQ